MDYTRELDYWSVQADVKAAVLPILAQMDVDDLADADVQGRELESLRSDDGGYDAHITRIVDAGGNDTPYCILYGGDNGCSQGWGVERVDDDADAERVLVGWLAGWNDDWPDAFRRAGLIPDAVQ